jgi:hypothetical protein
VKGRENQVAGFACRQRDAHGVRIAHFTYDDEIRRLSDSRSQGGRKIWGIDPDFDLFDDAPPVGMLIFDRVFNRDDVLRIPPVDHIDQRGHSGRLPRSCGTTDENQSVLEVRQRLNPRWQIQFAELRGVQRECANACRRAAALSMQVDSEPAGGGPPE